MRNNYRKRIPVYTSDVTNIFEAQSVPIPATLGYTGGVLTSVTKGGETKQLTYQDGRLIKVTSPTHIVTLSYDSAGNLANTNVANA